MKNLQLLCILVLSLFASITNAQFSSQSSNCNNTGCYNECAFTILDFDDCNPQSLIMRYLLGQGNNFMEDMIINYVDAAGNRTKLYEKDFATYTPAPGSSWLPFGSVFFAGLQSGYHVVEWTLPQSVLQNGAIAIEFNGAYNASGICENFSVIKNLNLDLPDAPRNVNASSDNCNGVVLSWDNATNIVACINNPPFELTSTIIYRNGVFVATVPIGTTTLNDFNSSLVRGQNYTYALSHFYNIGGNLVYGGQTTVTGSRKELPDAPPGFQASNGNCDGTINLTWNFAQGLEAYNIYRDGALIHTTSSGNTISYTDNVTRGIDYSYTIRARNNCGLGPFSSPPISGISPIDAQGSTNLSDSTIIGSGVLLSWPSDSTATSYKVERTLLGGGGGGTPLDVPNLDTFLVDQTLLECQSYQYSILSINGCTPTGVAGDSVRIVKLTPDLSNTFGPNALDASKGYFPNRVELNWTLSNNQNNINSFKIYRRELGSNLDSVLITSQNSGSNIYQDNLIDAGVLYEYFIIAELQCEQTTEYSNVASAVGFRSNAGVVSGQVNYSGGIAVENVKIQADNAAGPAGYSLQFSGTEKIAVPDNNAFDITDELSLEFWLNTNATTDYTLVEKAQSFSVKHVGTNFEFVVWDSPTTSQTLSIPDNVISANTFNQITATLYNDTMRLYVNGVSNSFALFGSPTIHSNTNALELADAYVGLLDEFRLWNVGKDSSTVQQDYSRQLNGVSADLQVYLKMNEGTGNNAYDFSRDNNTTFHKNHGQFIGSPVWSSIIPNAAQLAISTFTDAQGNYFLSIPFSGIGETFVIVPSFLNHNFNPSTRALFIGDGSSIYNDIDFEDISSFTVDGSLFFANTSCPVEGATLKVDGSPVIVNGQVALTNAAGQFNIQVPIGEHFITIEKSGHIMNVGRFPATGTYNFQNDLAGVSFQDTTLIKVVGRVVGGLKQASFIPGLGKSTNNIGQVDIEFESQLGGGCQTTTLTTDFNTGEYEVYLPPLRYNPTITPSNAALQFGVLNVVDLTNSFSFQTAYDTIGFDSLANVYYIDSISFNKQVDYIYRNDPKLIVKASNLVDDFIGDTLYTYIHPNGDTIERNLKTNPLAWPVFNGIGEDKEYTCLITAFEEYLNLQTGALDSVPTTDGELIFNNDICIFPGGTVQMSDVNQLDSLFYLMYTFDLGLPNFNINSNIPEYNFVKKFELNLSLPNGVTIPWKPDVFQGVGSPAFNTVYDDIFRAYVLGTKSDGLQFITEGPQLPEYVLRDPPGSNSFASREIGATKTTEDTWRWSLGGSYRAEDQVFVGTKTLAGIGVATEIDIQADITTGSETSVVGGRNGKATLTTTNLQSWTTNPTPNNPGRNSDLYIGKSKNVTFGISETLKLVPDSICTSIECIGPITAGLTMAKTYGVSVVPGGYSTQFIYTEDHIKNQVIPDLIELRNTLLSNPSRYTSNLPNTDPNYGLNNDDPRVLGNAAYEDSEKRIAYLVGLRDQPYNQPIVVGTTLITSETHYRNTPAQFDEWNSFAALENTDSLSITGDSYTFHAIDQQDSLTGDSVRWLNDQIRHWEEAIMLNEWEKLNIDNAGVRDVLKGVELTKLYEEYEDRLIAYNVFVALGGAGGALALGTAVVTQSLPGPSGAVAFAVTAGVGIAENELYRYALEYINAREAIYNKYAFANNNYSISSGASFTSSISHESASSITRSLNINASIDFTLALKAKISNNGAASRKGLTIKYGSGKDWTKSSSSSEVVSFTLNDQDPGDFFSVDVFSSLLGWGPVFKLQPGGKTSCPHEDAVLTEYYLEDPANLNPSNPNSPSFVLSERTQQRDKPTIDVAPSLLTNVPVSDPAVFNLTINNESESNDTRTYKLALRTTSNPFGAIVSIDGSTTFADVTIGPASSVNKVLAVEKGPGPTYNYDSLLIIVYAECNPEIMDSVYVSAHFLPTCTEVSFASPNDQWVLNNSFNDTLPVAIIDYNINFFDFNSIRLDYKPSSQSQWLGLQTFYRDTSGLGNPNALEIPTNTPFTLWDWETDQIVDGDYDLRLVSQCTLADKISLTHSGLMDRINPHPFGTPSPADGILDPNDDILIRFNEPLDLGSMTSQNFDVRGVINGTETTHASHLFFDGIDDHVVVDGGALLQNRDFTIEFSVKRTGTGQEVILSQGSDSNEQVYIGFDAGDHLLFKIDGQSIISNTTYTDNDWHYFAVAYDYEAETADMYEASALTTASVINVGNNAFFDKYSGADKLYLGKDIATNAHFSGYLDDVRIWNTPRTLSEFSLTKNLVLSSNQQGLLYNWRFDEAEGLFAKDHVRSRDGVLAGAAWTIEPGGNAVTFDGIDDYVRVAKGDVNITLGMDFTLEFWYNSTQTSPATLFSNGRGDGSGADSLFSWNIAKDANGLIHVYHNGQDFVATSSNTFDGEWHHFALVLNRTGNLTSYLDGSLENSVQALPFGELGGAAMYLGARGYYSSNIEIYDSYFEGQLDEFRLWDASRKFEQIARDKQNRMKGDEYALRLYMPFENYELDPTGIALLTPTYREQIDSALHVVSNPNGAGLTSTAPNIKLQRPIESIAFTYSLNNDEIIITPTTNSALIENVTLDITVKDLQDLNGNTMESPKTWIAYMDKNQVVWQDDLLTFTKDFGASLNFSSAVVNNGGSAKIFTIENLPSWLTASQTTGTIAPNSVQQIDFTIDPQVNIGDYTEDLNLYTDFGFPEKLSLELKVREEAPDWTVNPADYNYSMSVVGLLEIEDVVSTDEEDILGVFINGEARGAAQLQYVSSIDRYLAFLDVYSNSTSGETMKFKIWDASKGATYIDVIPNNLVFSANDLVGSILAPQLFQAGNTITQDIAIVEGWNWISFNLLSVDSTDLDSLLVSYTPDNGDELKGQKRFANYSSNAWSGPLAKNGIKLEDGYRLKAFELGELTLSGSIIDPTIRDINLVNGWNWIGFISVRNQSVTQALGNLNPTDGDLIKGKSQFALYDSNLGWVGSLNTMVPGQSYMYQAGNAETFTFPFAGAFKQSNQSPKEVTDERWPVNHHAFASNMTQILSLDLCELSEDELGEWGDWYIGVFDENNTCRGLSGLELVDHKLLSFMTISGNTGDLLNYRLLHKPTSAEIQTVNELSYQSNALKGDLFAPFKLGLSDEDCHSLESIFNPIDSRSFFSVYPTVFNESLSIKYLSNRKEDAEVNVYNSIGQLVYSQSMTLTEGMNVFTLDMKSAQLYRGTYFLELSSESQETERTKIIQQ